MYTSGIDQHKRDSVITTYDATGERVRQVRLPNDRVAISRYFAAFPDIVFGRHREVTAASVTPSASSTEVAGPGRPLSGLD